MKYLTGIFIVLLAGCGSAGSDSEAINCDIVPSSVRENLRDYCINTRLADDLPVTNDEIQQCLSQAIPAVQTFCRRNGYW